MELIKVKNRNGLYRDEGNSAIVNMNESEYEQYVREYKKSYDDNLKIKNLQNEVSSIKDDLTEIKDLLKKFLT